ncbi:glycosyltransferase [Thiohalorhabdus denitrificans]|uniref:glycosyltransferase n=1 Tax=Thiohalorhabdus denitrificans TaxID=381306 RepID=UPI0015A019AB|nr:glycosyltransferase [Thiohalorhabdus denitrificans]
MAILMPSRSWGGIERVIVNLINQLSISGIQVDLLLSRDREVPYPEELNPNTNVIDLGTYHKLSAILPVARYLQKFKPDALLTAKDHGANVGIISAELSRTNTPVFVSIHSSLSQTVTKFTRKFWVKHLYPRANAIITVSQGAARGLCTTFKIKPEKVHVIYNPITNQSLFHLANESPNHPWLLNNRSAPVILGVGRLSSSKDFPTLIKAFKKVREEMPARLLIIGEGEKREYLENLIEELGLQNDVDLPGFYSNPYSIMKKADLFALSSAWEGFGNVLAEAISLGTPAVSTNCPSGPSEILNGGLYGPLVPVGDVDSMAKAMKEVLVNPPNPESLRKAGLRFSQENIALEYQKIMGLSPSEDETEK